MDTHADTKLCSQCQQTKSTCEFFINKNYEDGLMLKCIVCQTRNRITEEKVTKMIETKYKHEKEEQELCENKTQVCDECNIEKPWIQFTIVKGPPRTRHAKSAF